jgi:molecular chaperone GrpE
MRKNGNKDEATAQETAPAQEAAPEAAKPAAEAGAQAAETAGPVETADAAGAAEAAGSNGTEGAGAEVPEVAVIIHQLETELEAERARAGELMDRLQRSAAEFQNTRRRQEKQMAEAIERASTHVIKRLLPVLDDLDLAFQNVPEGLPEDQAAWVAGFRQIQKKLHGLLEDEGVTPMPLEGPFDPLRHEAVTSEPNDSVPSGHIIATLRVGYEHGGKVLRPAMVRVAA